MLYFKVPANIDGKRIGNGYYFIQDELFTETECKKHKINTEKLLPIHISKNDTYHMFGARFATENARKEVNYEIRQLDSYLYDEEWTINTSYYIGILSTAAKNERKAFTSFLKKQGIMFYKGKTIIEFDGDCYTILDRKTQEPLFTAIPQY